MAANTETWQARLKLGFVLRAAQRSVLARQEHEGPILVQRALYPEGPAVCHLAVLHPPSGIAGGDAIDIDVDVAHGAHAVLTTPGATRWYKANGRSSRQSVRLTVACDARLDWLPLENLYFEDTCARNEVEIRLQPGARAIGWEIAQLGSILVPGYWKRGSLHSATQLWVADRLLWLEEGRLAAEDALRTSVCGLAGLPVWATLWCYGPRLGQAELDWLAERLPWRDGLRGGITAIDHGADEALYLVRSTGLHVEDVRDLLAGAWLHLREAVIGRRTAPLRLWST